MSILPTLFSYENLNCNNSVSDKLAKIGNIGILHENKKFSNKILPLMRIELGTSAIAVWCLSNWANLAYACKSETLISLCSHALLIVTKPSKYKNQVVHEQKTV